MSIKFPDILPAPAGAKALSVAAFGSGSSGVETRLDEDFSSDRSSGGAVTTKHKFCLTGAQVDNNACAD